MCVQVIDIFIVYALATALTQVPSPLNTLTPNRILQKYSFTGIRFLRQCLASLTTTAMLLPRKARQELKIFFNPQAHIRLAHNMGLYILQKGLKRLFCLMQFVYMMLVGTFPFNSFLSGFASSVGFLTLTGAAISRRQPSTLPSRPRSDHTHLVSLHPPSDPAIFPHINITTTYQLMHLTNL